MPADSAWRKHLARCQLGLVLLLAGSSLGAQARGTIVGIIQSDVDGAALPFGIVALPSLGREQFAGEDGAFVIGGLPPGPIELRVRRLGYAPKAVTVNVREGLADTVRVRLTRIALSLDRVIVRATTPCDDPGVLAAADTTLATLLTQLRLNAEQYKLLAREYPFAYRMATAFGHQTGDAKWVVERIDTLSFGSKPLWRYKPGNIVTRAFRGGVRSIFHTPTIEDFADPAFLDTHCFHNRGLADVGGAAHYRIDFAPAATIKASDVDGAIYLDSATFQIRRAELHLTRPQSTRGLTSMDVTTEFREVMPSIPIIWHISATQTGDTRQGFRFPLHFEEQVLADFKFVNARPGQTARP